MPVQTSSDSQGHCEILTDFSDQVSSQKSESIALPLKNQPLIRASSLEMALPAVESAATAWLRQNLQPKA